MRWVERVAGVVAAALALGALGFALSQRVTTVATGSVVYGPGVDASATLGMFLPLGLAVAAALIACLAALRDSGRGARRGMWTGLLAIAALFCVAGVVTLGLNSVWVETGVPPEASWQISAAVVFAPAALAALIAMFSALRPRRAGMATA